MTKQDDTNRIIEVNGIKLEVDTREAVRIDHFKIGSKIQVFIKSYSNSGEIYPGIIIGITQFAENVGIVIAYLDLSYSSKSIKYATITKDTTGMEICLAEGGTLQELFVKDDIIRSMENAITDKKLEVKKLQSQLDFFKNNFGKFYKEVR